MPKVITFGEIMLRLTPPGHSRFLQAESFQTTFGGSEANVAVALSQLDIESGFVTKLPEHDVGQMAVNSLRKYGVDITNILRGGEKVGVYYVEKGASQRGSKVIYDRKSSSIALADPEEFDWDEIFSGAVWLHFSGISPALSPKVAEICLDSCKRAKEKGLTVSCDLNYRSKLWTKEQANTVMANLMKYVDICIANEEDAKDVFGISPDKELENYSSVQSESYERVAEELQRRFGFKMIAITLRSSKSADDNIWTALLYDGNKFYKAKEYYLHLVDRFGAGDSFCAGLIYGLMKEFEPQMVIDFATAVSCLKQTIEGDYNLITSDEVNSVLSGNTSGRVQR